MGTYRNYYTYCGTAQIFVGILIFFKKPKYELKSVMSNHHQLVLKRKKIINFGKNM